MMMIIIIIIILIIITIIIIIIIINYALKTQTNRPNDTLGRLCGKTAESIPHVLTSYSALAQSKYLARHNAALKVLFWEMLREL